MKRAHKKMRRALALLEAAMFGLHLVFLTLLATSAAQSVSTGFEQDQWIIRSDNPQHGSTDDRSLAAEGFWPGSPLGAVEVVTPESQNLQTTQEPNAMKEQDPETADDSAVLKVVLVVAALLVSLVGCVSMAYYYCVWRGGRIHYQPQKEDYA